MAQGSLSELDTQIEIAKQLGYLDDRTSRDTDQRMNEIDKVISGLIRHLTSPRHHCIGSLVISSVVEWKSIAYAI